MMMLSLTSTLLFVDNDTNDADDVDDANDANDDANDINDINDVNNVNADDADDERRRKSSIEERKESGLGTSPDRAERLVVCCLFAPLAASQAKPTNDQFFCICCFSCFCNNNLSIDYLMLHIYNIYHLL
jgi:hypothetical protein